MGLSMWSAHLPATKWTTFASSAAHIVSRDETGAWPTRFSQDRRCASADKSPAPDLRRNSVDPPASTSSLRWSAPDQHGQARSSGSTTTLKRGRCEGSAPLLVRRCTVFVALAAAS